MRGGKFGAEGKNKPAPQAPENRNARVAVWRKGINSVMVRNETTTQNATCDSVRTQEAENTCVDGRTWFSRAARRTAMR